MKYEMKCCAGDDPRIEVTAGFVERNKLKIDINVARDVFEHADDFFGAAKEVAYSFLPYEEVKDSLNDDYRKKVESGEAEYHQVTDIEEAAQDFLDYMVFAWTKARDERGLSAIRSIIKLGTWLKIMGRSDVAEVLDKEAESSNDYGQRALRAVCDMMGIECPDDIR